MRVLERVARQARLVNDLVDELRVERSYRGIERLMQLVIQAMLDLGLMVISALKGKRPKAYSEIGYILQDLDVLEEREAKLLKSLAGLRNILVHAYATIDREKVAEFAERLICDAPRIVSMILKNVEKRDIDPEGEAPKEEVEGIVDKLSKVFKGRVRAAYLFGGRVKGYALKGDYDIAVLMNENYSLYELGNLQVDAAKALGVSEEQVDLICLNSAPPELVIEALEGMPIVEEDEETFSLKIRALMELLDLEENLRIISQKLLAQTSRNGNS